MIFQKLEKDVLKFESLSNLGKLISLVNSSKHASKDRPLETINSLADLHRVIFHIFSLLRKSKLSAEEYEEASIILSKVAAKIKDLCEKKIQSGLEISLVRQLDDELKKLEKVCSKAANWQQIKAALEKICELLLKLDKEIADEIEDINETLKEIDFPDSTIKLNVKVRSSNGSPIEGVRVSCGFFGDKFTSNHGEACFELPIGVSFFLSCCEVKATPLFVLGKAKSSKVITFQIL